MQATVVVFPGSNADAEMVHTLRNVVGMSTRVAWHKDTDLEPTDLVAIPGGFSYGDYLRCGAIARVSPIMPAIRRHAERGGYVIGVCNGFQILTEAGILPGALTRNRHLRFECRDVFVKTQARGPFTRGVPEVLRLPIAHAEGRYQADEATLHNLAADDRIAFLEALAPAPQWPVAFALAAADSGASARAVLASFAAGWAENATQAALKAVPLGQSAAQRILAALSAAIPAVLDRALAMATSEVQAFVPMLAILSSQHEEQYSRLFRS